MVNKIVFVKSGGFLYQEFSLSGNIHFSGPNGFGKTTLLKAVLFAYSGEPDDLGDHWQHFLFPHPDSMILYEIGEGKNTFTIYLTKVDANLEILLVKGIYEKEIFITGANQPNPRNIILKNIKKRKLDYIDQLKNGEDYRRIIFGQEEGKKKSLYRKFVLFESQKADLLIQSQRDVLSQNGLTLGELKDRIANLNLVDSQRVNLGAIRENLKEFVFHWNSIKNFKNNRELIPEIGLLRNQIQRYQSENESLANALINLSRNKQNYLKTLKKEILELEKENQKITANSQSAKNDALGRLETLLYQKAYLTHELEQQQKKQDYYQGLDITTLKISSASLSLLEEKKQEILFSSKKGQAQKKHNDFFKLQNQLNQQELKNNLFSEREKIITNSWQKLEQLEEIFLEKTEELTRELNDQEKEINILKSKAFSIRREGMTDIPVEFNADRIVRLEEEFYRLSIEKERSQNRLTQLQRQKEIESEEISRNEIQSKKLHKDQVANLNRRIEQIKSEISDLRGSFQEWLEKNYPDWEQTIGKICRPEVLRNPYLGPEIERLNELFYGIKLDLDEVEPEFFSNQDLQIRLQDLESQLEALSEKGLEIDGQFVKKKNNLDKRFRQKIRQEENGLKKLNYEIDQVKIRLRQQKQAGNRKRHALIQEVEGKAIAIDYQIQEKESLRQLLKDALNQALRDLSDKKLKVRKEVGEKLKILDEAHKKREAKTTSSINKGKDLLNTSVDKLSQEELQILLFDIEEAIIQAKNNRETLRELANYSEYDQDKYKGELELIELKISALKEKDRFTGEINARQNHDIDQEIILKNQELESVEKDLFEVKAIKKSSNLLRYFVKKEENNEEMGIENSDVELQFLLGKIRENHQKISREELKLKQLVNQFVSMLGEGNLMSLSVEEVNDYLELARILEEFEEKNQVDEWEEQLAIRYANLVTELANLTKPVQSYQSKLEDAVAEFNQILSGFDYNESFPMLKLSCEVSNHPLNSLLKKIQQFSVQNANQLGAGTLFSQSENHQENHQAITLMTDLYQQINLIQGEYLDPCIFFQLKLQCGELVETDEMTNLSALNKSEGLIRLYEILIHLSFISLVFQHSSSQANNIRIHCGLDNLLEIEPSRIDRLMDWIKDLPISIVSASVSPLYLKNIDQVYRLSEKTIGTINAYRILNKAG